ncbi:C2 family cysteine protease [Aerosakkonema sp. BLCC-F183]|uniref:C2 family cysteine protease n=1 Tax=Aerosakkonema sp. BLCC-F183 TaxID=3342834 RepID=UPI0035B74A8F
MSDNFLDLNNAANTFAASSENPLGLPIRGLGGSDRISGWGNADVILGNTGADIISGFEGADALYGGRGADLLFGNQGADQILGERGNDVIFGGRDNDVLLGGEGDDFLAGDAGTDILTGGDGSDAFVLDIRHSTTDRALADVITDFSKDGEDVFALTDGANDALTEADLNLETVGSDTFISLKATGAILARVQGVSAEQITGTFSTVRATLDDTEPGATTLSLIPGKATVQGQVGDEDYVDFFQFQVTETSIVDFSLTGLSADADLALYQDRDADGEVGEDEVISQSVRSGNANETIENVTLNPGNYFLSVEQYEGDTNYNLNVAGVAGTVARDLAGSQASTARQLPPDGEAELHDYVGGTDAVDTYRLEVINEGYLDVFTDYQEAAVNLNLWSDRNGNNQLDIDEIVAQGTNEIQLDSINPGTYYVSVTAPGVPTPYEISAINSPGSRVDTESYNTLFPGLPTTGTLSQKDDSDPNDPDNYADPYLLPDLGAGLTVTVTQESKDFDAYLRVVDLITGEVVAENDDIDTAGGNYDARVSFTTQQEGQYVVYASSVDAPGVGDYSLNATVTGTPTQTSISTASVSNSSSSSQELTPLTNLTTNVGGTPVKFDLVVQPLTGGQINSKPINAMHQGGFGDCFFMAALTATFGKIEDLSTAASKESTVLNSAITNDGNNYTISFNDYQRQSVPITVDNQVLAYPTKFNYKGRMVELNVSDMLYGARWAQSSKPTDASGQPIWASIFERAFANLQGGYEAIANGGDPGLALVNITGGQISELFSWKNDSPTNPEYSVYNSPSIRLDPTHGWVFSGFPSGTTPNEIFKSIQTALDGGGYVVAGTPGTNDQKPLYNGVLQEGHAYSVHNAYVDAQGRQMILLRNPWGQDNSGKTITEENGEQKILPVFAEEDPSRNFDDGFVAITFDAFLKNYYSLRLMKP